jgi:hypothetical protein
MKFTSIVGVLAVVAQAMLVTAKHEDVKQIIATETVFVIEYTEVCACPTSTAKNPLVPALTTITCCESCAPIPITATTQLVTSCATSSKETTTICDEAGVYHLGDRFYPCNNAPCTIKYDSPCQTCYVCAYSDCWAPNANTINKPKNVKVYEYVGDDNNHVGYWEENWALKVFAVFSDLMADLDRTLY